MRGVDTGEEGVQRMQWVGGDADPKRSVPGVTDM